MRIFGRVIQWKDGKGIIKPDEFQAPLIMVNQTALDLAGIPFLVPDQTVSCEVRRLDNDIVAVGLELA